MCDVTEELDMSGTNDVYVCQWSLVCLLTGIFFLSSHIIMKDLVVKSRLGFSGHHVYRM